MFDFDVLGISEIDEARPATCLRSAPSTWARRGRRPTRSCSHARPRDQPGRRRSRCGAPGGGAAVVARQQRPLGIVTGRDLLGHSTHGADGREPSIVSVMTACLDPLRATDTVGTSLRRMCAARQWHLPIVCARGLLLGSIDIADLTLWLRDRMTLLSVDAALALGLAATRVHPLQAKRDCSWASSCHARSAFSSPSFCAQRASRE